MSKKTTLHPSVKQFKQFVQEHPLLIKEVREGAKSWQDFYEEWTILGEKDQVWEKYRQVAAEEKKEPTTTKEQSSNVDLVSMLKSVNLNDLQHHITNISGVVSTVMNLLQSFQPAKSDKGNTNQGNQQQQTQQPPFPYRHF